MILKGADKLLQYLKLNIPEVYKGFNNTIYTLDLECSNGYIHPGSDQVIPFDYDKAPAYYNGMTKVGLCYLWQFGVDDVYFYGRELRDLIPVLDYIAAQKYRSYVWVHNFSYEFWWLLNLLKYTDVFARQSHQLISADYDNIKFRCTYMLSRQKLENIGANLGYKKLTEVMDYDRIYTPASDLPRGVIKYGIRDIEILYHYVLKQREKFDGLQKIPLTQTGVPRKYVRELYVDDWSYHVRMSKLLPRDHEEYSRLKAAFIGGWVHANYFYVGVNLKNMVRGRDITSSYPYQMVARKYPLTAWAECSDPEDFDYYVNNKNFLEYMLIKCDNIESAGFNDYLSESKVFDKAGVKTENGRIYKADSFRMLCTCVDYDIIRDAYKGDITIERLWYSRAGYLDKRYVNFILDMYYNKVSLTGTGDPVKEELRARSKEILNSLYGMMVSALVYDPLLFVEDDFKTPFQIAYEKGERDEPVPTEEELNDYFDTEIDKLREKPFKLFTNYSYGVFVTAWARKSLYDAVSALDRDVVYHDTDSVYYVGDHEQWFEDYNEDLKQQLLAVCKRRKIPEEKVHPNDEWLGVYKAENKGRVYTEFKTLGSKRYAYRKTPDTDISCTVSGVSKKYGYKALVDNMDNFVDNLEFGYKDCGKLIPHYNNNQPVCTWTDDNGISYTSDYQYGITLQPTRYIMGLTDFFEVLAAIGSLSDQYSEMEIEDLVKIGLIKKHHSPR